jgi:hypothetical protein
MIDAGQTDPFTALEIPVVQALDEAVNAVAME